MSVYVHACMYACVHVFMCVYARKLTLWSKLQVFVCILQTVGTDCVSCQTEAGARHPHWSDWSGSPTHQKTTNFRMCCYLDCCLCKQGCYVSLNIIGRHLNIFCTWLLTWKYFCVWKNSVQSQYMSAGKRYEDITTFQIQWRCYEPETGLLHSKDLTAEKMQMLQTKSQGITDFVQQECVESTGQTLPELCEEWSTQPLIHQCQMVL